MCAKLFCFVFFVWSQFSDTSSLYGTTTGGSPQPTDSWNIQRMKNSFCALLFWRRILKNLLVLNIPFFFSVVVVVAAVLFDPWTQETGFYYYILGIHTHSDKFYSLFSCVSWKEKEEKRLFIAQNVNFCPGHHSLHFMTDKFMTLILSVRLSKCFVLLVPRLIM